MWQHILSTTEIKQIYNTQLLTNLASQMHYSKILLITNRKLVPSAYFQTNPEKAEPFYERIFIKLYSRLILSFASSLLHEIY